MLAPGVASAIPVEIAAGPHICMCISRFIFCEVARAARKDDAAAAMMMIQRGNHGKQTLGPGQEVATTSRVMVGCNKVFQPGLGT